MESACVWLGRHPPRIRVESSLFPGRWITWWSDLGLEGPYMTRWRVGEESRCTHPGGFPEPVPVGSQQCLAALLVSQPLYPHASDVPLLSHSIPLYFSSVPHLCPSRPPLFLFPSLSYSYLPYCELTPLPLSPSILHGQRPQYTTQTTVVASRALRVVDDGHRVDWGWSSLTYCLGSLWGLAGLPLVACPVHHTERLMPPVHAVFPFLGVYFFAFAPCSVIPAVEKEL